MEDPQNKTNGNGKKFLVYMGSSTPEKLRDYQHICEQKGLPIYFRDIRELLDAFRSSEEKTGKYRGNVLDKLSKVQSSIITMLPNSEDILKRKCEEYGMAYEPSKIFFATEDGGFRAPKLVWEKMDKTGIPKELLIRIRDNKDNKGGGPGVETAGVLSAVGGARNLMGRIIKAARDLGFTKSSQVQITEKIVLTLTPFKQEVSRPPVVVEGETTNYLFEPDEASLQGKRVSTLNFVRHKDHSDVSCADIASQYVAEYSARSKTIEDLAAKLGIYDLERHAVPLLSHPPDPFMIGLLPRTGSNFSPHIGLHAYLSKPHSNGGNGNGNGHGHGHGHSNGNGLGKKFSIYYPDRSYIPDTATVKTEEPITSRRLLGDIEEVVKGSDGFMLLPDAMTGHGNEKRFEKFYALFSLIVAKQLVARDMQKPIVILNHDGSWDEAIANHIDLVNIGMTKDHNLNWVEKVEGIPKGVTIQPTSYFDVVKGGNYDDTLKAGLQLMAKKREKYQRRATTEDAEIEGGIKPEMVKDFKVAVFCSACNENEQLNENMEKLGYGLAKKGFGVVYGAGDRYTMGAVLKGVVRRRNELIESNMNPDDARKAAYIAGISTAPILISETEHGQFSPELSYYKQTKNIYNRMADMIDHSNALVVAPGGAGTLQEWVAPLMMKKIAPDLFKNKGIVIYNPGLFNSWHSEKEIKEQQVWNTALKTVLGVDYELLTSQPETLEERARRDRRCKELGIYVETDEKHIEKRIGLLHKAWQKPHGKTWVAAEKERRNDPPAQISP